MLRYPFRTSSDDADGGMFKMSYKSISTSHGDGGNERGNVGYSYKHEGLIHHMSAR